MSAMSTLHADVDAFERKLHDGAAHLVDEFKSLVGKLLGEAENDAAPLAETAKADAETLAADAAAGAEAVVSGGDKPSA